MNTTRRLCRYLLVAMQARRGRLRRWMVAMGLVKAAGPTNNRIRTSKYTPLTFLPANLLQQFMRAANLYFLGVVFMQTIPGLSPTPWQATALPLVFVLTVNAIKVRYSKFFTDLVIGHLKTTVLTLCS